MMVAFYPVITNACGAKDYDTMRKVASEQNKLGTLLILFFALPIMLELPEILRLWLRTPPPYTYGLCLLALAISCVNTISTGQMVAIDASGKIKAYQIFLSLISIFTLPLAWLWVKCGGGIYGMRGILLMIICLNTLGRVLFAQKLVGMSARYWGLKVLLPLIFVTALTCIIGFLPHLFLQTGIFRLGITAVVTEIVFSLLVWLFLLNAEERDFMIRQIQKIISKIFPGQLEKAGESEL